MSPTGRVGGVDVLPRIVILRPEVSERSMGSVTPGPVPQVLLHSSVHHVGSTSRGLPSTPVSSPRQSPRNGKFGRRPKGATSLLNLGLWFPDLSRDGSQGLRYLSNKRAPV